MSSSDCQALALWYARSSRGNATALTGPGCVNESRRADSAQKQPNVDRRSVRSALSASPSRSPARYNRTRVPLQGQYLLPGTVHRQPCSVCRVTRRHHPNPSFAPDSLRLALSGSCYTDHSTHCQGSVATQTLSPSSMVNTRSQRIPRESFSPPATLSLQRHALQPSHAAKCPCRSQAYCYIHAHANAVSSLSALTLHSNRRTASRRLPAVPQLACTGSLCREFTPDVVQCVAVGSDGVGGLEWKCEADLPTGLRFGEVDVSCEGWGESGGPDPRMLSSETMRLTEALFNAFFDSQTAQTTQTSCEGAAGSGTHSSRLHPRSSRVTTRTSRTCPVAARHSSTVSLSRPSAVRRHAAFRAARQSLCLNCLH